MNNDDLIQALNNLTNQSTTSAPVKKTAEEYGMTYYVKPVGSKQTLYVRADNDPELFASLEEAGLKYGTTIALQAVVTTNTKRTDTPKPSFEIIAQPE